MEILNLTLLIWFKIMLKENLTQLGLSPNEAEAYMFLLKNVKSKASELAKYLGVTHPAAKKILDNLINKELIRQGIYGKTTYYFPESSDKIIEYITKQNEKIAKDLEKKTRVAQETKSLIEGTISLQQEDTDIKFYKGKEGIDKMVEEIANSKNKKVYEFIDLDLTLYSKHRITTDWSKTYKEKGVKFETIVTSNKKLLSEKKDNPNANLTKIDKKLVEKPTAHLFVFDDKIAFSFITDDRSILIIKNFNL